MAPEEVRDGVIRRFVKGVLDVFPNARIIHFGSRARGDHLKTSDYDFLVISSAFEGMSFFEKVERLYANLPPGPFQAIPLSPEEFEQRRDELSIIGVAAREGIELSNEDGPA